MHRVLVPSDTPSTGLVELARDTTAPDGLSFHHANEGKPLATPWQIAALRAQRVAKHALPKGYILDCACGSGVQLAAYGAVLKQPLLGVELAAERAKASAVNLHNIASYARATDTEWYKKSLIIEGDGTDPEGVLSMLSDDQRSIAFLHLDPARPRNSRTHSLEEMMPPLHLVLGAWKPHFNESEQEPAVLLDLSPRLVEKQRAEVEAIVDEVWPGISRTWEWTSRGRGRVDRLALWLGGISDIRASRRFVRVPSSAADAPIVLSTNTVVEPINVQQTPPKRGEWVSILDAALLESGLMAQWLKSTAAGQEGRWAFLEGRRPQLHHDRPLQLENNDQLLVQATGKVVELLKFSLDEATVDELVEIAISHQLKSVKLRYDLDPSMQPKLQGSLDRQLRRRNGNKNGFVAQHPHRNVLLLCVCQEAP